jgi:hypothetical protein
MDLLTILRIARVVLFVTVLIVLITVGIKQRAQWWRLNALVLFVSHQLVFSIYVLCVDRAITGNTRGATPIRMACRARPAHGNSRATRHHGNRKNRNRNRKCWPSYSRPS